MVMTEKQQKVYDRLLELYKEHERAISPTEIGMSFGIEYDRASPYCTSGIQKAVRMGLLERTSRGHYIPIIKN